MSNEENYYHERVIPKVFSLWPVLLMWPTAYLTLLPFNELAAVTLGPIFVVAILVSIWFASPELEVSEAGVSVGEITVPLQFVSKITKIDPSEAFAARGVNLSPGAFTKFQMGVNSLVKIDLNDPDDKTPYWLIATKNPQGVVDVFDTLKRQN